MHRLLLSLLLIACGCVAPAEKWVAVNPPEPEVPVVNLPTNLHERNWVDARGSGSCVHASTLFIMKWQGQYKLAEQWKKTHAGGETANSIMLAYEKYNLPYTCTLDGDPLFLVWATKSRRGAIVWWKPYHCCAFVGISVVDGREYAIISDNNRPGTFEKTPLDEFIRKWRGYGGFACTLLLDAPHSPLPWPSSLPESYLNVQKSRI